MSSTPLIGLTLDSAPGSPDSFSRFDHYALRQNYFDCVVRAGGAPVGLGHNVEQAMTLVARLDGLIVTGGAFDPDPALYGEPRHTATTLKPARTHMELSLLHAAKKRSLPVLGICGGMQLMAIAAGGTLFQHLPEQAPGPVAHEQVNPRNEAGHDVEILPGTCLSAVTRAEIMQVNSSHHQGVRHPGVLRVAARAADGLIEAIEAESGIFWLGVQWHPEFAIDPGDARLLAAFIKAARHAM